MVNDPNLDFSKSMPIDESLDFSKAQPISGRYQPAPSTSAYKEMKIRETAKSPISSTDVLKGEAQGFGDVLKGFATANPATQLYESVKNAYANRTPEMFEKNRQAKVESWKKEYNEFKADPYAYLLRAAPRALGQAAGVAVTGKALPEIPGLVSKLQGRRAETAAARITERMAAMTEGEPTAELVKRVAPGLKLSGSEPMHQVARYAEQASMKITQMERQILQKPSATPGVTIGDTPTPAGKEVAAELRKLSTSTTQRFEKPLAKAIENRAKTYESGTLTPNQLKERLDALNRKAKALYSKPDIEAALANHDPALEFLRSETNAVRNVYYKTLEQLSKEDMRPLKQMQSDLIGLQKAAVRPVAKEAQIAAEGRAHPILGAKDSLRRKAGKAALLAGAAGAGGYGGYKATRMFTGR